MLFALLNQLEVSFAGMSRQCSLLLVVNQLEVSFGRSDQAMLFGKCEQLLLLVSQKFCLITNSASFFWQV